MPAEPDDGDELTDAYNQVRRELDAEDDVSECGGALGATTTINPDGRRYHPACARGDAAIHRAATLKIELQMLTLIRPVSHDRDWSESNGRWQIPR
ncbi:MAG TPA: hypothetical protein VNO74_04725 [Methylomirabilota bacterium]|nr:hypothetical protein [Methylomirabilota bacterium]